ncbi:MAG: endonuclease III [Spirochaetae bacterium HGW-Spirochaetae-7]|nr:MAG: endonuclease III [Spirochaetae bacterium HGW-Spirochaetae-7]
MDRPFSPSAEAIFEILVPLWPDSGSALSYRSCFELLVAVILSAQCTDEQVNKVTPLLFAAYPDPASLSSASRSDVEAIVRTTGFFRVKTGNIMATAAMLIDQYDGRVPDTIEELTKLPGVGRKTANLVVSVCYGKPGIVVDTHVLRTAGRLGLAPTSDPAKSERMIGASLPESMWTAFSYELNRHGKHVCRARKPLCASCPVASLCPSADDLMTGSAHHAS